MYGEMIEGVFGTILVLCTFAAVTSTAPSDAVLVFTKGEGGYYCHKIPYLLKTQSNVLIALAGN